jgi:hypothetical protein
LSLFFTLDIETQADALQVWGRLVTCSGLVIRLVLGQKIEGQLPNGRQLPTCPHDR